MKKLMFDDHYGLTQAVLEGKKTQTRRIARLPQKEVQDLEYYLEVTHGDKSILQYIIDTYCPLKIGETIAVAQSYQSIYDELPKGTISLEEMATEYRIIMASIEELIAKGKSLDELCRSGEVSDILKLQDKLEKKTFYKHKETAELATIIGECSASPHKPRPEINLTEIADGFKEELSTQPGWENKLFVRPELMPHRIRITDIRLERLQDISDEDCLKEGIKKSWWMDASGKQMYGFGEHDDRYTSPREAYAALIDKISGKGTWDKNPWVFVYDFIFEK